MVEKCAMDFNPLDLLATAAVLQREDPESQTEQGAQDQTGSSNEDDEDPTEEEDSESAKMGSVKHVQSCVQKQHSCNLNEMLTPEETESENQQANVNEKVINRSHSWCDSIVSSSTGNDITEEQNDKTSDANDLDLKSNGQICGVKENSDIQIPKPLVDDSFSEISSKGKSVLKDQVNNMSPPLTPAGADQQGKSPVECKEHEEMASVDNYCFQCRKNQSRLDHSEKYVLTVVGADVPDRCLSCHVLIKTPERDKPNDGFASKNTVLDICDTQSKLHLDKIECDVSDDRACAESTRSIGQDSGFLSDDPISAVSDDLANGPLEMNPMYVDHDKSCDKNDESNDSVFANSIKFDHCYASALGRSVCHSGDFSEDTCSIDGGDSDSCTDDVEHRAESLSVDSSCFRCNFSESSMQVHPRKSMEIDHDSLNDGGQTSDHSMLSPSSVDSLSRDSCTSDIGPPSLKTLQFTVPNTSNAADYPDIEKGDNSNNSSDSFSSGIKNQDELLYPKVGKFKIGTFASISGIGIDKDITGDVSKNSSDLSNCGSYFDKGEIGSPTSMVPSSPGLPTFLQSPCADWDRSDAGSEIQEDHDLSLETLLRRKGVNCTPPESHSVYHDHDYCLRGGVLITGPPVTKYAKVENKKYSSWSKTKAHQKERRVRGKYNVKGSRRIKTEPIVSESESLCRIMDFKRPDDLEMPLDKNNSYLRPKRKYEKYQDDLELDAASKMKITGKYQDQYVYYLSKSSRSTRRTSREFPLPSTDKIILPAPKPGDIIVPHLTDADIEAIKLRGKSSLSISEKYYGGTSTLSGGAIPTNTAPVDSIADFDSKIISTILSMENDNLASESVEEDGNDHSIDLYSNGDSVGINFMGETMPLTSDQVDLLLNAMEDVERTGLLEDSSKFVLDNNQNYNPSVKIPLMQDSDRVNDSMPENWNIKNTQFVDSDQTISGCESKTENMSGDKADLSCEDKNKMSTSQVSVPESVSDGSIRPNIPTSDPSQSPVKALLDADLSNITHPSFGSALPEILPVLEKPFDFMSGDFKLDKSDLFPEAAVTDNPVNTCPVNTSISDYNTPWIVTVTMFWNDLPAIMIDNIPYVRLVDIHKQILPAKDTGILKKRCQLIGIKVLNCAEMQRYFLVQYGRAYNSKSTLIISKDDAKDLIGYYVNPQPRLPRSEDAVLKREFVVRDADPVQSPDTSQLKSSSRKRIRPRSYSGGKASASSGPESSIPSSCPASPQTVPVAEIPVITKRLRHKKINFLEMLKGESVEQTPAEEQEKPSSKNELISDTKKLSPQMRKKQKLSDAEKLKVAKEELKKRNINIGDSMIKKVKVSDSDSGSGSGLESESTESAFSDSESSAESSSDSEPSQKVVNKRYRSVKCGASPVKRPINLEKVARENRFHAIKVNVKSMLKLRSDKILPVQKNNTNEKRVLGVRHKDANPSKNFPSVSQDGDIYLDLYKKKSSLSIRCCSCKKFFSLRNFMAHQHYPDDKNTLTTIAQPQLLEPRASKLSSKVRMLWMEFNKKKQQLDGPIKNTRKSVLQQCPLVLETLMRIKQEPAMKIDQVEEACDMELDTKEELPGVEENTPVCQPEKADEHVSEDIKPDPVPEVKQPKKVSSKPANVPAKVKISKRYTPSTIGIRVSGRRKKERQLFPIENYSYSKQYARQDGKTNEEEMEKSTDNVTNCVAELSMVHGENVDSSHVSEGVRKTTTVPVSAVPCDSVVTLCNGPEIISYTALQESPEM
ncbi:uncharacterized protein LOC121383262 [Gigantopelta aegis]|uniref:uncharacterized protein LOC121383262 n=1 Tax=Gigantopelta aegis TaxID=1735272 RepID=UPI001B889909|nr:uncharacterized protein LOC121383262 [Gigantopelta aegis]XP_041369108.1 uncharacterized protein LOC121383262 [Gigantopelta aegis]